jgi:tetratricopeptide (TPR) repeat protein
MPTLFEFSQQIAAFKKEKKFSEALSYFRDNKGSFSKEQIGNNEYIVSDMISCLRYSNHLDAGFQFLSIYGIAINEQQKERILSAYGWLLWAKYKAENENNGHSATEDDYFDGEDEETEVENFEFNKSELLEKVETLIPILNSFNSDFTKTLSSNLFTIVLKSEKKKPAPNWKLINEFCNKIDREKISKDCSTIQVERKGQLKDMELASDFENWYAYKTKALSKLGEWQECFDLSKEALERIETFHYSNDVWFSRRVALSKRNLGNTEDTIQELQSILKKKREWFIQKELAELYFEKGNIESALKQATDAMNNFGPLEFKVDLLYLLGKILRQQDKLELSFQHFSLSKLIRQAEEWKLPQKLFDELRTFTFPEIPQTDFKKLKNELQKYWDSFKATQTKSFDKPRTFDNSKKAKDNNLEGEIVRILHDNERGKVGFLKSNGKEHYFSVNPNFQFISKIAVGTKVLFEIKPATDGKKEQTRIKKIIE